MKQISICLIMAVMCLSSCKPEIKDGGCTYEGVYIETVTGLVNAHNYQITLPGSGGRKSRGGLMKVITGHGSIYRFRRTGLGRNARTYLDSTMSRRFIVR